MKIEDQGFQKKYDLNDDKISFDQILAKFKEWADYLRSKWIIILFAGVFGGALGFWFSYLKKPSYTATTTFVLEAGESSNGGGLSQYAGLISSIGIDIGGSSGSLFQGDNIFELYNSRMMIEKTLLSKMSNQRLFIDYYLDFNNAWDKYFGHSPQKESGFGLPALQKHSRLQDSVIREVVKDIRQNYLSTEKTDKKLNIIEIKVIASDEFFAKEFNDQIVKNVNDFYIQTKTKKALQNVGILQEKTDSVRRVMNGAILRGAAVADATPNLNPSRQVQRVVPMQRSQFNVETNKAVLAELLKNLELSKLSLLKETPLIQVIDQPIFPLDKTKSSKIVMTILGFSILVLITVFTLLVFGQRKQKI